MKRIACGIIMLCVLALELTVTSVHAERINSEFPLPLGLEFGDSIVEIIAKVNHENLRDDISISLYEGDFFEITSMKFFDVFGLSEGGYLLFGVAPINTGISSIWSGYRSDFIIFSGIDIFAELEETFGKPKWTDESEGLVSDNLHIEINEAMAETLRSTQGKSYNKLSRWILGDKVGGIEITYGVIVENNGLEFFEVVEFAYVTEEKLHEYEQK